MLYLFADCALDTDRRELRRGSSLIPVEPQVFDLLAYLIHNRERVVSKDDLLKAIWHGRVVTESALTTRINAARSAIGDSGEQQHLIKTLPRKGVRFVGMVRETENSAQVAEGAVGQQRPAFALPVQPSIAVLPFTNMSGHPDQDYFADGMAEEIITALSCCNWLFVIARNSSFTYKGRSVDVRQIGRELGVRYLLEGSVRRAATRLRFVGQLIDAESGAHIWANRFEGEMSDVFELQDRFAQSVVAAIEPELQLAEIERLKRKPAASLDAYDLLLRAQQLEYEFTAESLRSAIRCLEQALVADPTYAPAMALAAYCYAERRQQGWTEDPLLEIAHGIRLAERALELGKDDGNVLWMASFAVRDLANDGQRAKELAHRSLRLNPNSAVALANAGWMETMISPDPVKALELFRRAERLNPRDPRGWLRAAGMALACLVAGNFDESASLARSALNENPRYAAALRFLASSLAKLGQRDQAAEIARQVLQIEPQFTLTRLRARLTFMDEGVWSAYADGMRLAGLPE